MELYLEGDVPVLNTRALFANTLSSTLDSNQSPLDSGVRTLAWLQNCNMQPGDTVSVASLIKAIRDTAKQGHAWYAKDGEMNQKGEPRIRKCWLSFLPPKGAAAWSSA